MIQTLSLGKVCTACGKERKPANLKFDPDGFMPYCATQFLCNEKHPNSVPNIIVNMKEVDLLTYDEALAAYKAHLNTIYIDTGLVKKMQKLLEKPISLRFQDPATVEFLITLQAEKSFPTMTETVKYCIEVVMESKGQFYTDHKEAAEEVRKEEEMVEALAEVEAPKPKKAVKVVEEDDEDLGTF